MIVLDAFALEAFFGDEPATEQVYRMLESGEQAVMNAVNYAEVVDRLVRVYSFDPDELAADVEQLAVLVTGLTQVLANEAALLRARHYHRLKRPVSLADCCAAAHTLDRDARLATADQHLLDLMVDEGGFVEVLPTADGFVYDPYRRS